MRTCGRSIRAELCIATTPQTWIGMPTNDDAPVGPAPILSIQWLGSLLLNVWMIAMAPRTRTSIDR